MNIVVGFSMVLGLAAGLAAQASFTLGPSDLSIWNDPVFKQRFAESYLAETDIEPRLDLDERDQMQAVLELLAKDKVDAAIQMLQKLQKSSKNAAFDFTLGNLHFQREELDLAIANFQRAIDKFPRFRRAHQNLGILHIRRTEFAPAMAALVRVIELGGGNATTYGLLGYAHGSLDNPLAAESAYRMASLLDPNTMDWKMGLARAFLKQKRFAELAALCSSLLAKEPARGDLWMLQANAYLGLEQATKAAENFEIADRLGAASVESLNLLGDIYTNGEQYELAVDAYSRALRKDPNAKPERTLRGVKALVARSAHGPAKQLLQLLQKERGAQLEVAEQKELLKLKARLATAEGAGEEEAKVLAEVVALDPLDGEALLLLGLYENRTGNPEQAIFYYQRAASLEKFEADAKIRHAQLLVGQGKYSEAVPLLRRAQQLQPRDNLQQYLDQVERLAANR
jgi:tetratricopeptide (TPR) repeat protein